MVEILVLEIIQGLLSLQDGVVLDGNFIPHSHYFGFDQRPVTALPVNRREAIGIGKTSMPLKFLFVQNRANRCFPVGEAPLMSTRSLVFEAPEIQRRFGTRAPSHSQYVDDILTNLDEIFLYHPTFSDIVFLDIDFPDGYVVAKTDRANL